MSFNSGIFYLKSLDSSDIFLQSIQVTLEWNFTQNLQLLLEGSNKIKWMSPDSDEISVEGHYKSLSIGISLESSDIHVVQ